MVTQLFTWVVIRQLFQEILHLIHCVVQVQRVGIQISLLQPCLVIILLLLQNGGGVLRVVVKVVCWVFVLAAVCAVPVLMGYILGLVLLLVVLR